MITGAYCVFVGSLYCVFCMQYKKAVMWSAGSEEHLHDVLLADDTAENSGEPDETSAVETADADDDNDEFVEWNEGDGSVLFL